jgi:tRNA pseudouridine55 synthase
MLLVDKPTGISSFGIVARVRRVTGIKKVGHAGTLDPLASGLMLILVGREETKQAGTLLGMDKTYETIVRIGEQRSTGDLEGEIVAHATITEDITRETVEKWLKTMVGTLNLPVPAYSAIKRDGQRLYAKARKGQEFEIPRRDMLVHGAHLRDVQEVQLEHGRGYELTVIFNVASGVYIRSLSEELGRLLGYPATTAGLRRTQIGQYFIDNAQSIDEIEKGVLHPQDIL